MFASLQNAESLWTMAGWTMLHYLWLGMLVGLAAGMARVLLRRVSADVRYAAALASLAILAMLPIGIGAWLVFQQSTDVAADGAVAANDEIIELKGREKPVAIATAPASPGQADADATYLAQSGATGSASASPAKENSNTQDDNHGRANNTGRASGTRIQAVAWFQLCVPYLPWLWIIGTPLTFGLLASGIIGAERLRRNSRIIEAGPLAEAVARLRQSLGVSRRVVVAVCERIAAPVLVGIVRPIILLPPAALTGWSPEEIEMVLLHELAHVRRWDNLVNLAQRLIESLLFFHPAVWLVSAWVRREREACCDAIVVSRTHRPHAYAEMLVALAAQMPRSVLFHPAASSAMAARPLRARIRRILQLEDDPMLVSGKSFAVVIGSLLAAATLTVMHLPTVGQAEETVAGATEVADHHTEDISERDVVTIETGSRSLADAVREFNEKAMRDEVGKTQPPLTEEEVVATICGWNRDTMPVSDDVYEAFRKVAETRQLSPGASLDFLTSCYGCGVDGEYDLKGWWIGLNVERYRFLIRETKIRARRLSDAEIKSSQDAMEAISRFDAHAAKIERAPSKTKAPLHRFPTLEDQKLADLAWSMLQLELEPISDDDLKRVKALGYDGGVKVTAGSAGMPGAGSVIQFGDILVGLHVWPTANLQQVADVLQRDDLGELNPLKFYVVRREMIGGTPENQVEGDVVRTGRVSATIGRGFGGRGGRGGDGRRATQLPPTASASAPTVAVAPPSSLVAEAPSTPPWERSLLVDPNAPTTDAKPQTPAPNKANLRYDGKSFDEWSRMWRTELSTERRLEAVKALAAFGSAGYGKEAAEAILEVVKQYDWLVMGQTPVSQLKNQAILAFAGNSEGAASIPIEDWLPLVVEGIRSGDKRVAVFAQYVFQNLDLGSESNSRKLIELSRDETLKGIWPVLLQRLQSHFSPYTSETNPEVVKRMEEALSEGPAEAAIAVQALYPSNATYIGVGGGAYRGVGDGMMGGGRFGGESMPPQPDFKYRPELVAALQAAKPPVSFMIIDALKALGPKAAPAVPELLPLLFALDSRSAAQLALALRSITGADDQVNAFLQKSIDENESPDKVKRAEQFLKGLKRNREVQEGAADAGQPLNPREMLQRIRPGNSGDPGQPDTIDDLFGTPQ